MFVIRQKPLTLFNLNLAGLYFSNEVLSVLNLELFFFLFKQLNGIFQLGLFIGDFDSKHAVLGTAALVFLLKELACIRNQLLGIAFFFAQTALVRGIVGNHLLTAVPKLVDLFILLLLCFQQGIFALLQLTLFFSEFDFFQLNLNSFNLLHFALLFGHFDFAALDFVFTLTQVALDDFRNLVGLALNLLDYFTELLLLNELVLKTLRFFAHLLFKSLQILLEQLLLLLKISIVHLFHLGTFSLNSIM